MIENIYLVSIEWLSNECRKTNKSNSSDQPPQKKTGWWTNQNFKQLPVICSTRGKNRAYKVWSVLLLIGWKTRARYLSQLNESSNRKSNGVITFDSRLKTASWKGSLHVDSYEETWEAKRALTSSTAKLWLESTTAFIASSTSLWPGRKLTQLLSAWDTSLAACWRQKKMRFYIHIDRNVIPFHLCHEPILFFFLNVEELEAAASTMT